MPQVITVISSDLVRLVEKGTDGEWRFGLAHEYAGGDVEGFRAAGTHDSRHDPGKGADENLHHADVVEKRENRGDEYDRGQHLKSKDKAKAGVLQAEVRQKRIRSR